MYSAGGQCALSGAVHGGLNLEAAAANAHHDEHASGAEHCAVRDERPEAHLGYIHLSEHCHRRALPLCKGKPAKQRLRNFASKGRAYRCWRALANSQHICDQADRTDNCT